ncbi:hypothetical protein [Fodinicola feengrottensis]|uniref:hypothetical protein n=1 Tax=Fodinicola feengrottensis TaxID=435914 RepID=UPI00244244CD|nr:hypothetical protein [Fodinicola feengrottensis]
MSDDRDYGDGGRLDARRLWAGAVVSAVIAALVAIAGILVARGIFNVPLLAPKGQGVWGGTSASARTPWPRPV